jgi:hypothetical protein
MLSVRNAENVRDCAMIQRRAKFGTQAANDNCVRAPRAPSALSKIIRFPETRSEPLRLSARSLLVGGFAGVVLFALCGAFLVGLAAVGVLALVVAVLELFRYPRRNRRRGAVEHQVVRYP